MGKVSSDADFCTSSTCAFYKDCFSNRKEKMNESNILIVNHHILFADIAIRSMEGREDDNSILLNTPE